MPNLTPEERAEILSVARRHFPDCPEGWPLEDDREERAAWHVATEARESVLTDDEQEDDARERRCRMKQRFRRGLLEVTGSGIRPRVNRGDG